MGLISRSTFDPHPECVTIGTLADIQDDPNGKFGPQIKWIFDTEEEMSDGRPFRVTYWTSYALNEKSNLNRLLKAFGENPDDAKWDAIESLKDFEFLLGSQAQLNIVHKKNEAGGVFAKIDTVLPIPRRRQRGPREEREAREPVGAGARNGGGGKWDDED